MLTRVELEYTVELILDALKPLQGAIYRIAIRQLKTNLYETRIVLNEKQFGLNNTYDYDLHINKLHLENINKRWHFMENLQIYNGIGAA